MPQTQEQKIRSRLRRYERRLQKEKKEHGFYRDGAGKRYQIGPYYLLLGDNDGALAAFQWFEQEFSDETRSALPKSSAMLGNLYVLPHLLQSPIDELDIWHGSSDAEPGYIDSIPEAYFLLWTEVERDWASGLYQSPGFQSVRERYIEISRALNTTRPGPERSRLVEDMYELER